MLTLTMRRPTCADSTYMYSLDDLKLHIVILYASSKQLAHDLRMLALRVEMQATKKSG